MLDITYDQFHAAVLSIDHPIDVEMVPKNTTGEFDLVHTMSVLNQEVVLTEHYHTEDGWPSMQSQEFKCSFTVDGAPLDLDDFDDKFELDIEEFLNDYYS
jgi:hypothetical protein